ncbi:membrane bound O-acyl transferase family-domain-containing protein [Colletotrichum phormii]|uniref:Membrane bound O-acyl transferase family-domain-containing protein n=1 Tax=Colletotrichum phormii TaxID=359342 RepID=A0AAI9ZEN9_9PEZI|nr:membrane bound O-acyl transferase family-domain-containing protein [Colletotrichum phormii]KAK1623164.1 membrane bound O-acyl transferase family-domain-containing protein [Colletotrichum phormii]
MWLHGELLALVLLQVAFLIIFTGAILFSTRGQKTARMISVAVLAAITHGAQSQCLGILSNPHWRAIATPLCWIQFLSASQLTLSASTFELNFRQPFPGHWSRACLVLPMLWNLRRVGTPLLAKNTPPSPKQSRLRFISERLLTTTLAYLTLDLIVSSPAPSVAMVGHPKQTLWNFHALSREDFVFRMIATATFWISVALLLLIINNCAAILGVICGCYSPGDCPPLFGSFVDVKSIRQFWGAAWHQCLRVTLTTHANILVDLVFRITGETALSKYTRLWCAFMISALIHHSSDIAMGIDQTEAGSALFFSLQALGIMLEDGFQAFVYRFPLKRKGQRWNKARLFGRLWVISFLVWSTPTWSYPQQRLGVDAAMLLPVRITPILVHAIARLFPAISA